MGRPVRSGISNFPRILAGLLVPVLEIVLLTFYFSNRPEVGNERSYSPTENTEALGSVESAGQASSVALESKQSSPKPVQTLAEKPTISPSPTQKPTLSPSPTLPLVGVVGATVNAQDGLNIRSGPSTNFGVVRVAPFGELVELTGESASEGDLLWVELVEDGWVQDRYLDFE